MKLSLTLIALVLTLFFSTAVAVSAESPPPDEMNAPASVETEPNDDFDTAEVVGWGARRAGTIGAPGDILTCYESDDDEDRLCDRVKLLLDVSELNLGGYKIDAFEMDYKR